MKSTAALALGLMLAASPLALAQTSPAAPQWYLHQADEMRASNLIGTRVVNTANEAIGTINEIVLGKDGKVSAMIIGVGGFLGMGEHEIAVTFSSLQMQRDQSNNLVFKVNATKDVLKAAPAWKWESTKR